MRAEVRQIAVAVASDTVMRYSDALARSPYAQQTIDTISRRVASEAARAIADERIADAAEIVRRAAAAAEQAAAQTAEEVAGAVAARRTAEASAAVVGEAREAVEKTLGKEREDVSETLQREREEMTTTLADERRELTDILKSQRLELTDTLAGERTGLTEALGRERTDLTDTLDKGRAELTATLGAARSELTGTVDAVRADLTGTIGTARTELTGTLAEAREELTGTLAKERQQLDDALARTRRELDGARGDLTQSVARFAREEAARVVTAAVAETVPPVIEVSVNTADPVRISGHTHTTLPDVLLALGAGCHVLLVGPAGTGKSMMAQQAAEGFGQEFHALSLGPTTPMSKIFGYYDAHGNYHDTPFRRAFEHGGLMLLDELDSGHPGLLAELNQALSLRSCAFADGMVAAHPEFRLVATANTYGTGGDRQYVGRQALDAATLDRFVIIDVPVDEELEERVALAHAPSRQEDVRRVIGQVRRLRATAAEKRLPVMFSPRASIDAARLIEAGASVEQAVRWRVVRGMSAAHRSALGTAADTGAGAGGGA